MVPLRSCSHPVLAALSDVDSPPASTAMAMAGTANREQYMKNPGSEPTGMIRQRYTYGLLAQVQGLPPVAVACAAAALATTVASPALARAANTVPGGGWRVK